MVRNQRAADQVGPVPVREETDGGWAHRGSVRGEVADSLNQFNAKDSKVLARRLTAHRNDSLIRGHVTPGSATQCQSGQLVVQVQGLSGAVLHIRSFVRRGVYRR